MHATDIIDKQANSAQRQRAGFSLVEVTLAMMVVAVGILSVLSLFPTGLDQNARSIADTRMAFFAEDVLNGLHAWAEDDWEGLTNATTSIPIAASNRWEHGSGKADVTIFSEFPECWTNKYFLDGSGVEKYALRYCLSASTNGINTNKIKAVTLLVWGGEFGTTNNPAIFYTEFFKYKK